MHQGRGRWWQASRTTYRLRILITSGLERPSARRRAMQAWVRGSLRSRGSLVLPDAQDADEGGVHGADVGMLGNPVKVCGHRTSFT